MKHWKPVVGFESLYEVSDLGQIRSIKSGKLKAQVLAPDGRYFVMLWKENKQKLTRVHRAVLIAFRGAAPPKYEACHNNGDSRDNRLDNLRWDTATNNQADKIRHGTTNRGERCGTSKLTLAQVNAIRADTRMQKFIAADYGVRQSAISRIKAGVRWAHD